MLNIIYIHSHDTGRYVSPYGHRLRTPHLERFARQGVLFRQAFCNNPTCSPSRASLLTGQWAHCNGMLGLAHRGFRLNDPKQHLGHTLKAAGYRTALCGTQHEISHADGGPTALGYDEVLESPNDAEARAEVACRFLRSKGRGRTPLFMSIGFFETHRRFPAADPADDPRYLCPPAPLPDTPETRQDFADYATMAHRLDAAIGRILDAIDNAQLADDTLVIVTTDHGPAFPLMKCHLTDHGIGVMLMVRGPFETGFTGGATIDAMVQHLDVFPTICELTGIAPPPWLQGRSLLPLVRGEVDALHEAIFAEVNFHAAYEPMRAVRTERYKYIRRYDGRDRPVLPNCDASLSKRLMLERGWADRRPPQEQLYDLWYDPYETGNRAADPQAAETLDEMRSRLDAWMRQTNDPILRGPLEMHAGVKMNPPDGLEPDEEPELIETPRSAP